MDYTLAYQQGRAGDWPHPGIHKPGMISEKEVPYRAASPKDGNLKISGDSYVQMAELLMPSDKSRHLPASILRISLYKDQPYMDMEVVIQGKEKDNWPEADWLCLPFRIDRPEFNGVPAVRCDESGNRYSSGSKSPFIYSRTWSNHYRYGWSRYCPYVR